MNCKVQTLDNISKKGLKLLGEKYTVLDHPENPDAILVRSFKMHDMDIPDSVKFIGRAGAGVNNIPLEKCSEKGIVVCNSPGANANAVKELVIAGMLISSRKVVEGIEWANTLADKGDDVPALVEKGKSAFGGPELYGKKMGVIGLGAIGVLVANMAIDFGMKVYGFDPFISIDNAWGLSRKVKRATSKEEIFKNCDYISLHIPFMEQTKDYVDADLLKNTKKGLRLVNFARGGLVNYDALEDAIEEGVVAAYVADFPNERLLKMKNVINIPHLGASTPESEENCAEMAVNSLKEYLENGNIINSVNYPDCNMGVCDSANRITVNHANIPKMLGKITTILADNNINISDMANKNKGSWAYTMIDVDSNVGEDVKTALKSVEGVTRVRIIK
ncbi:phosphoglycerate dehydrogenase [Acetobacterium bakii]|uniref:D-3-phosphoglycerate dehydrogenase n=1 Tax=Acetobacterium bakii TaxID=52689 RepID=A0A0L6U2W1_9FIRM|nr:phosphoglycerate dehydrogenase [Acetobacterium bakii]KNZ42839.1 3-phosphoglycerate dehydrogenase [Acetobacterium bakii]